MKNPALPHLLKAMAYSMDAYATNKSAIYEQAAIELEKLNKIYEWAEDNRDCACAIHTILYTKD